MLLLGGAGARPAWAQSTIAVTAVGVEPSGVAFNPTYNRAYVVNRGQNNVSVIDTTTSSVVATFALPAGADARGVAVDTVSNGLYITGSGLNKVYVFNCSDNTYRQEYATPSGSPWGVAVNPNTKHLYVTILNLNQLFVVNEHNGTTASIPVGSQPVGVAVNTVTNRIYVANNGGSVTVIDGATNTAITAITSGLGANPRGIAVDPTTNRIYVTNAGSDSVSVINGNTNAVIGTVPVGASPLEITVSPSTGRAYVPNYASHTVTVIDGTTNTSAATIPVGVNPVGVALNSINGRVYVTNSVSNNVSTLTPAPAQSSPKYIFTDLGTLGGVSSGGTALNENGQVTGYAANNLANNVLRQRAFSWDPTIANTASGTMTDPLANTAIGPDYYPTASGINNAGIFVGTVISFSTYNSIIFSDGFVRFLNGAVNPLHNEITGINESSNSVGYRSNSNGTRSAIFKAADGTESSLPQGGSTASQWYARKINDNNQIAGFANIGQGSNYNAVFWESPSDSSPQPLGTLAANGSGSSEAYDIAETGRIVGLAWDAMTHRAFLWDDIDLMQGIGGLGTQDRALGINNNSVVVGQYETASGGEWRAFIWDYDNGMRDLNELISLPEGYVLTNGRAINDKGQITGTVSVYGIEHAFLLTPVAAQQLESVTVEPAAVTGGTITVTGTVTLSQDVTDPVTVALNSSDPAIASAQPSVTISSGKSATFTITTTAVAEDTAVTVTGTLGSAAKAAVLLVLAPTPQTLSFAPSSVIGGNASTGTIILNGPAPSGGYVLNLSSGNTSVVNVPASVSVPAGSITASFTASTTPVASPVAVTVSATSDSDPSLSVSGTLNVHTAGVSSVTLNPSSVWGGQSSQGTVTLGGAAPNGGYSVSVSAGAGASVPASVTVAAGATSATFTVTTTNPAAPLTSTITASDAGSSASATLSINAVRAQTLTLTRTSVYGGTGLSGTVTLNGPAPAGCTVSLTSSNSAAQVPASVSIAQGAMSATFAVTTSPVDAPDKNVTISGAYNNSVSSPAPTAALQVRTAQLLNIYFSSGTVKSNTAVTLTIPLNAPAGPSGAVVGLSSNNKKALSVPNKVTVPAGQTSITLRVSAGKVTANTPVTVTATHPLPNGISRTATVTVTP